MEIPQKAFGEIHQMPEENIDFRWRIRCTVRTGENMPLNNSDSKGLPSCYLQFGWSESNLNINPNNPVWLLNGAT